MVYVVRGKGQSGKPRWASGGGTCGDRESADEFSTIADAVDAWGDMRVAWWCTDATIFAVAEDGTETPLPGYADALKARDDARRDALTAMLDRLGGDGVVPMLNGDTPEQVADALYDHVEWLERRARCEALQDVLRVIDPVALDFAFKADEGERDEKLHETRLRNAIIVAARR